MHYISETIAPCFSYTDVNECATQNGGCHHNCHNTVGSYHCSCNDGYTLGRDDHTCSGKEYGMQNYYYCMQGIAESHGNTAKIDI